MLALFQNGYSSTVIIANKASGLTSIDKNVKNAFLGKAKNWPNGVSIEACLEEADAAEMTTFYSSVLKKSPAAFRAYWNRLLFSGKAPPPKEFSDRRELIAFVDRTKGAVCFTTSAEGITDKITILK